MTWNVEIETSETAAFMSDLASGFPFEALFGTTPNVCLFVKNRAGRFVWVNAFLVELCGAATLDEIVGKSDFDFFPRDLALDYRREDETVVATGTPIVDRPWLVCNANKTIDWFLSNKWPLRGRARRGEANEAAPILGVVGAMRNYRRFDKTTSEQNNDLSDVVDFMLSNYERKIETRELAELAFLSTSQFERRFRAVFRMTPSRFLAEIRLRASARLLTSTDLTLAQVASRAGFFDQSHFGKAFRAEYGTTPKKYRAAYGTPRRESESDDSKERR